MLLVDDGETCTMGREPRIDFEGAFHHVAARGVSGADIYLDDLDREVFLELLSRVVRHYRWRCHAYCLMSTHYHLLVETILSNLSRGMRDLNGAYVRAFNSRRERAGHLLGARYRSVLIESDRQFAATAAYIAENPVKAGLCVAAEDWRWGSYAAVIGEAEKPSFLTLQDVREHLGPFATSSQPLPRLAPSERPASFTGWETVSGTQPRDVRHVPALSCIALVDEHTGLVGRRLSQDGQGRTPGT
jgi:putative transposase